MVGAVGAIVGARRGRIAARNGGPAMGRMASDEEKRRWQAHCKEEAKKRGIRMIIDKYDVSRTGKLDRNEVMHLLTDLDSSTPPNTAPADDELDFVFACCDANEDGCIDKDELEEVLSCWSTFTDHRSEFEEKLKKYDVSNTGSLTKGEMKAYFVDLNGGKAVNEELIEEIFTAADADNNGTISKMELQRATTLWYGIVGRRSTCCCCAPIQLLLDNL